MHGLLTHTLARIDSLEEFYLMEFKSIKKKSDKGLDENRFAMLLNLYLKILADEDEEIMNNESFKALQQIMAGCVEIEEIRKDEQKRVVSFKLKDCKYIKDISTFDYRKGNLEYQKFADMPQIHANNTLIMLIIRFEEFISNVIASIFTLYPNKYLKNQSVTFLEISNLGIDEVKENILRRETESIMHQSYVEWFKLFESHKMNFEKYEYETKQLKELYARRNILVHNAGKVNAIYLKNVPDSDKKIDEQLIADEKYLEMAFNIIKKIIFAIIIEASKFYEDGKEDLLDEVFGQAFEELSKEHYTISAGVFDALRNIKWQTEEDKLMEMINYWISIKEMNGLKEIEEDIKKFDTSALNLMFHLAKLILLDEFEQATVLIEDMLEKKEIPVRALIEWPLFKKYRLSEDYKRLKESKAEIFNLTTVESSNENSNTPISIRSQLEEMEESNVKAN